ncbi:MAG: radical SAM protein [Clostridia bacterium]|nr:radical SAM protein [Clostridia bacterium]
MKQAKETNKVLFVGSERICRQVAYVLAIENYKIVETLTNENYDQYQDYTIYVCEFKRKSKKLITKIWKSKKDIQYLDDICRQIDKEYLVNRRRHRKELKKFNKKTLLSCCFGWIYNLLKVVWHLINGSTIKHRRKINKLKKLIINNNYSIIKSTYLDYLQYLDLSVLFLYVLRAPVNKNIQCSLLESHMHIIDDQIYGCCSAILSFGSLLTTDNLFDIYHSVKARIIKLSSLNGSYCLCNTYSWCPHFCVSAENSNKSFFEIKYPKSVTLAFDRTCNLHCKSCRNERYIMDDLTQKKTDLILSKILDSKFLNHTQNLTVAGQGEVFYSRYYRKLLEVDLQCENICIMSNGTLFNEENWNWIKNKYNLFDVIISVDAARAETYSKLRCGGDFQILIKNLKFISSLKNEGLIRKFNLNFVVQRDNFREMPDFVRLGKSLGVNFIEFQRMNDYGSFSKEILLQRCLIINDEYLDYELWQVLQDPIFKDPIVDLSGLNRYIVASDIKYGKNKC